MIGRDVVNYLQGAGADVTPHSGRSLMDHLLGVARKLEAAGAGQDEINVGLCHSIYGTNVFKTAVIPEGKRAEVRRLIGAPAERLVWAFHCAQRPRAWVENHFGFGPRELSLLLRVEIANLEEQHKGGPHPGVALLRQRLAEVI